MVARGGRAEATSLLSSEIEHLLSRPPAQPATTLLLLPGQRFVEFEDFMEFLSSAREIAEEASALAPIQTVPFHPEACYSDADFDPADFSTRSPVPMLHLLRDSDVKVAEDEWKKSHPEPMLIQERNAAYLRGLGWDKLRTLLRSTWQ